tara:strand:+ start:116 stop:562 length:447 start_codon:yes stop_codon:yes gene_type:complete
MLTNYFTRESTLAAYYSGQAGPYLDDYSHWLKQGGYKYKCIGIRLRGVADLGNWAMSVGHTIERLAAAELAQFRRCLIDHSRLYCRGKQHTGSWLGAQSFFEFLQAIGIVEPADSPVSAPQKPVIVEFEQWIRAHRGVRTSTLTTMGY